MKKTIYLDPSIKVLVVSSGGVGTTFLIKAIQQFMVINDANNVDGYKHLPIPPIATGPPPKVIYVFGDPILATLSLFRRKYQAANSYLMQKYKTPEYLLPMDLSLEDYANNGNKGLFFEQHFDNWYQHFPFYETLFIHYNAIYPNLREIQQFLDLPDKFIEDFPKAKTRSSTLESIPDSIHLGLQKLHGDFANRVAVLPTSFIRPAKSLPGRISLWQQPLYRQALTESGLQSFPLLRKLFRKIGWGN